MFFSAAGRLLEPGKKVKINKYSLVDYGFCLD